MKPSQSSEAVSGTEDIQVDLHTPLEAALSWLVYLCVALVAGIFFFGYLGTDKRPPNPALLAYIWFPLAGAGVFGVLRLATDCYYIVRPTQRRVDYHFQCLFYQSVRPFLSHQEISAVSVTGVYRSSRYGKWCEYHVCLVQHNGATVQLTHPANDEEGRLAANASGELIASALQVPFHECGEWRRLVVLQSMDGNSCTFEAIGPSVGSTPEVSAGRLAVSIVGIIAFIVFLVVISR